MKKAKTQMIEHNIKPPNQRFNISLVLKTECIEKLTTKEIEVWVLEQFIGCDVGNVSVNSIHELEK